jgi:DNA-binding beta-propeller fold protein YncE
LALGARAAPELTPTGQAITPTAARGAIFQRLNPHLAADPNYTAGQASAVALSPDGRTLLILTSGFNREFDPKGTLIPALSGEYVFVFDVSGAKPTQLQALVVPDAFLGVAWAPAGDRFFVSGGVDDDVLEFAGRPGVMRQTRMFRLGHKVGLGLAVKPEAAGLAVSPDGRRVLVANFQHDSVSLIDLASGSVTEKSLLPGGGRRGGTFPRAIAWTTNDKAYVASERDREIIALAVRPSGMSLGPRIVTRGQPVALLAAPHARLFAAIDNTDAVAVIDTRADQVIETIPTAGPPRWGRARLGGAGSNALALSGDTLLVSNGGENALAVVRLDSAAGGGGHGAGRHSSVVGLIPTGWYPTGVAVADGRILVVNGKSNAGPNPANRPHRDKAWLGANQYVWQNEKAGFLSLPSPTPNELAALTAQVASNNHRFAAPSVADRAMVAFLRAHIHHVIYVVKENRTYDQVLGDLEVGDGDPRLAIFGAAMTPNQHALARQFVDLDRFFDSGESSNTGWSWTLAARTNDFTEREAPVNYAHRGLQFDQEGDNRNLNVGLASEAARRKLNPAAPADPDTLPGASDVAAPDGPDGDEEHGYLWDNALRAGLSVRNWGFYGDIVLYDKNAGALRTPKVREPWKTKVRVFTPDKPSLMALSDPYFRGFDQGFPDYWRFKEWEREFDGFVAAGKAPNLMLVRLAHDHTGDFDDAIDGLDTVATEVADNDYAVGLLVQKVAESRFAKDTLIFVVEDDAQDGPDHIDAHRSIAFVAGPYVKQQVVVSQRYDTVDLVRTIEAILGLPPMGLTDAAARPMTAAFDTRRPNWRFGAKVPDVLRTTALPLPPGRTTHAACERPRRSAAYWAAAMAGQDFSAEDHLDTAAFNLALWRGFRGGEPYPDKRGGRDLRAGRAKLLAAYGACS